MPTAITPEPAASIARRHRATGMSGPDSSTAERERHRERRGTAARSRARTCAAPPRARWAPAPSRHPEPQFESVASAVPSRNAGMPVTLRVDERIVRGGGGGAPTAGTRAPMAIGRGSCRPTTTPRRRVLDAADDAGDAAHQKHEGEARHAARAVGGSGGTSTISHESEIASSTTFTPKNQRHDDRRRRAGSQRAGPSPRRCRRAHPRSRPRGAGGSPVNSASMAASEVVKQQADATPCNARPEHHHDERVADRAGSPTRSRSPPRRRTGPAGAPEPVGDAPDEQERRREREARAR